MFRESINVYWRTLPAGYAPKIIQVPGSEQTVTLDYGLNPGDVFVGAYYVKGRDLEADAKELDMPTMAKGLEYTQPNKDKLQELIETNGLVRVKPSKKDTDPKDAKGHVYHIYTKPENICPVCGEFAVAAFCDHTAELEAGTLVKEDEIPF